MSGINKKSVQVQKRVKHVYDDTLKAVPFRNINTQEVYRFLKMIDRYLGEKFGHYFPAWSIKTT